MLLPHQKIKNSFKVEYQNIHDLFSEKAKKFPDKTFLISPGIKEEIFTYTEFSKKYLQVANSLNSFGLKKGDRINLIIENSPEFLFIYFAGLTLGITIVPINQDLAPNEMLYIINDSQAKAIFYDPAYYPKIEEIKNKFTNKIKLYSSNEVFSKIDKEVKNIPEINHFDEAVIIYTSGTTGNPKGVVLTHLNLLSDAKAVSEWFQLTSEDRTLCILPLFHNNGQVITLLNPLYAGGSTVIVKGKASLMSFWGLTKKYSITWTSVMPAILAILLSLKIEREDETMKGIVCGGQVLNKSVQDNFEKRFKVPIFEGFGLTETTSFACFNYYPKEKRKERSVGCPLPVNEITIIDNEGRELGSFEDGEICIKGLNIAKEYLGLPQKNKQAFKNGWFHSGDFGYHDETNHFYFQTRKDFLIIKGGENIYPAELENVLFKHTKIAECAVIGIPDPLLGEDIAAFVKLNDNEDATEEELKIYCKGKIAKYKQAKKIIIIDHLTDLHEIPKGPTKKVLYRKLKDYYLSHNIKPKS